MVELIVALLAGLIVATGIVALSREATNTFHEETRASSAEAALRAAIDRLRADLQRAGYMSTGNIIADPMIAAAPGGAHYDGTQPGISGLASILYKDGGSYTKNLRGTANPDLSAAQSPAINPDLIDIGGNMTTADQYDVAYIGAANGNCTQIFLSASSPAMYRLLGNGDAGATELAAAFEPDPTYSTSFIVRLLDESGHAQYLATCNTAGQPAAGVQAGVPYVNIWTGQTPIRLASATKTVSAITGYSAGRAWVNPVQIVQWEITTKGAADAEPAQFVTGLETSADGGSDPTKYDLMRSYLAVDGATLVGSEIVAEYAVDLKFAFTVDTSTNSSQPSPVTYAFDDTNTNDNDLAGGPVSNVSATPQRIRSVRARLAVRAAQGDRNVNIAVAPAQYGSETYMYRYTLSGSSSAAPANGFTWARVRTVTTEVALPNQARNFY